MISNLAAEKRDMLIRFLNQFEKSDDLTLTFVQIYDLYKDFVKEKELTMTNEGIRVTIKKVWPYKDISGGKGKPKLLFMMKPKIFKYLEEKSMRGKRAKEIFHSLYDSERKKKKSSNKKKTTYFGKDIARMDAEENRPKKTLTMSNTNKRKSKAFKNLNTSINSLIKEDINAHKLFILAKVKKIYEETVLPINMYSSLDMYLQLVVGDINNADTIPDIKIIYNSFKKDVEKLKTRVII